MANMLKNIDLLKEPDDDSKWTCFSNGSVEVVKKIRNKEEESKKFSDAQNEITKDVLPKQATAEKDMKMTPTEAFIEVYPNGNPNPIKPATKALATLGDVLEEYLKKKPFTPSAESK